MPRLFNHCSIGTSLIHSFVSTAVVWTMLASSATSAYAANEQLD
jgi:hypothetical protein